MKDEHERLGLRVHIGELIASCKELDFKTNKWKCGICGEDFSKHKRKCPIELLIMAQDELKE